MEKCRAMRRSLDAKLLGLSCSCRRRFRNVKLPEGNPFLCCAKSSRDTHEKCMGKHQQCERIGGKPGQYVAGLKHKAMKAMKRNTAVKKMVKAKATGKSFAMKAQKS